MAVGAMNASPSLSLAYRVGGGGLSPGLWLRERPFFHQHQPQLDNCARSSCLHV